MEDDEHAAIRMGGIKLEDNQPTNGNGGSRGSRSTSRSGSAMDTKSEVKAEGSTSPPAAGTGSDTPNSSKPRLSRKPSQKAEPQIYSDLPDSTDESCKTFQVIPDCLYGSKNLGSTDNDAFDCDCREEWRTLPAP